MELLYSFANLFSIFFSEKSWLDNYINICMQSVAACWVYQKYLKKILTGYKGSSISIAFLDNCGQSSLRLQ